MILEFTKEEFDLCESILVSQQMIQSYSEASGDHNPIHTQADVARSMGLEKTIAHGMLLVGLIHKNITIWMNRQSQLKEFRISGLDTKFLLPIYSDSRVFFRAQVISLGPSELTLAVKVLDQNFKPHVTATVRLQK